MPQPGVVAGCDPSCCTKGYHSKTADGDPSNRFVDNALSSHCEESISTMKNEPQVRHLLWSSPPYAQHMTAFLIVLTVAKVSLKRKKQTFPPLQPPRWMYALDRWGELLASRDQPLCHTRPVPEAPPWPRGNPRGKTANDGGRKLRSSPYDYEEVIDGSFWQRGM